VGADVSLISQVIPNGDAMAQIGIMTQLLSDEESVVENSAPDGW
jgi:hypothetical protein